MFLNSLLSSNGWRSGESDANAAQALAEDALPPESLRSVEFGSGNFTAAPGTPSSPKATSLSEAQTDLSSPGCQTRRTSSPFESKSAQVPPRWKRVFLQRAAARRLLQHEWLQGSYAAHWEALEENRRLLASQASFFPLYGRPRVETSLARNPQKREALAQAPGRQLVEESQNLTQLHNALAQLERRCAEQERLLLFREKELARLRELLAEREAEASAAKGACVLLMQKQEEQQLLLQKVHQEGAEKARETEVYLRELLQYKEAEAAALEALNSGFDRRTSPLRRRLSAVSAAAAARLTERPSQQQRGPAVLKSAEFEEESLASQGQSEDEGSLVEAAAAASLQRAESSQTFELLRRVRGHNGRVKCSCVESVRDGVLADPAFRQSGGLIATAGEDGAVNVFALKKEASRLFAFDFTPCCADCVALDLWVHSGEPRLLWGGSDGGLLVFDLPSQKCALRLRHPGKSLVGCGFIERFSAPRPSSSPKPEFSFGLWAVGREGTLCVWTKKDNSEATLVASVQRASEATVAIASADRAKVFVGFADGSLCAFVFDWHALTQEGQGVQMRKVFDGGRLHREGGVVGLAASPDGSWLLSVGKNGRGLLLSLKERGPFLGAEAAAAGGGTGWSVIAKLKLQNLDGALAAAKFSSDGIRLGVALGRRLLVYELPSLCEAEGRRRQQTLAGRRLLEGPSNPRGEEGGRLREEGGRLRGEERPCPRSGRSELQPSRVLDLPFSVCTLDWQTPFLVGGCTDGSVAVLEETDR